VLHYTSPGVSVITCVCLTPRARYEARCRAGMVTAVRHTKTFCRKYDRHDRRLPQACCLPAPAGISVPGPRGAPITTNECGCDMHTGIGHGHLGNSTGRARDAPSDLDGMAMGELVVALLSG
jgi:hypothetical protein